MEPGSGADGISPADATSADRQPHSGPSDQSNLVGDFTSNTHGPGDRRAVTHLPSDQLAKSVSKGDSHHARRSPKHHSVSEPATRTNRCRNRSSGSLQSGALH